jgi:hypothetical protein
MHLRVILLWHDPFGSLFRQSMLLAQGKRQNLLGVDLAKHVVGALAMAQAPKENPTR